jgi:hypothetical protein
MTLEEYSPFGSFAMAELLSSGLLLLLTTSNRGPSEGFLGVFTRAFSYSLILSRGGGVLESVPLSKVSTACPSSLVAFERVASAALPPGGGTGSPRSSPG